MDFYVGQTVRVNDKCHTYYDDESGIQYVWGAGMYPFCGHVFTVESISKRDGRIYLISQYCKGEDGYVTSAGGRDVSTFYFVPRWLTPVDESVDTTKLDEFFREWGE